MADEAEDDSGVAELAESLHWQMFRIASAIRRREYAGTSESDLSLTQCSILYALRTAGPIRLSDLAAHEGVRAPTMTLAVSRLEKRGMVRRRRDPVDKRGLWVEATSEGIDAQRAAVSHLIAAMQSTLTVDELEALQVAMTPLERFAVVVESAVPSSS
ncbi:MarR family winged helix-turn-helix transcriptional regulator [Mycolicibacterium arenosum]|uniref:MarR family transcriptional regulator n=1 Tax=Mycolicibacterium arenosum TaxID=2952157 RepID=A0ABT1MDG1_9MYCO|nr:MarR family transcriptional regulator [Mycolicibacterium sp. CAU 1645]MCP9276905.1 MarR family transcriptional regulator [Mycolicibacterium sp. CAU 1645]